MIEEDDNIKRGTIKEALTWSDQINRKHQNHSKGAGHNLYL